MRIVVINLPAASDRRRYIDRQIAGLGLQCEFFEAIYATHGIAGLFDACDERRFLGNTGRRVTRGEIGCYASHRAVWRQCVDSGEAIVVLEDDARLDSGFPAALRTADSLIGPCGFIRLQAEQRAGRRSLLRRDGFTLVAYSKMTQGAAAYIIAPDTAAAFLSQTRVLDAPVDVFIRHQWKHRQRLYGLRPYTVSDSCFTNRSTIGARQKAAGRTLPVRLMRSSARARQFRYRLLFRTPRIVS